MKKHLRLFPLSLIATLCILIASLIPIPEIREIKDVPLIDKWVHFVMYGGLSCAVWVDMARRHLHFSFQKIALLTFVCPIVLGGLAELAQAYLTTCRSGDWLDVVANTIGVVLAVPVGLIIRRIFER